MAGWLGQGQLTQRCVGATAGTCHIGPASERIWTRLGRQHNYYVLDSAKNSHYTFTFGPDAAWCRVSRHSSSRLFRDTTGQLCHPFHGRSRDRDADPGRCTPNLNSRNRTAHVRRVRRSSMPGFLPLLRPRAGFWLWRCQIPLASSKQPRAGYIYQRDLRISTVLCRAPKIRPAVLRDVKYHQAPDHVPPAGARLIDRGCRAMSCMQTHAKTTNPHATPRLRRPRSCGLLIVLMLGLYTRARPGISMPASM